MATVTISAPEASTASRFCSSDAYFPVPTMRRDLNALSPNINRSSLIGLPPDPPVLAAPNRAYDLDTIPGFEVGHLMISLPHHPTIHGHCAILQDNLQVAQQLGHGDIVAN